MGLINIGAASLALTMPPRPPDSKSCCLDPSFHVVLVPTCIQPRVGNMATGRTRSAAATLPREGLQAQAQTQTINAAASTSRLYCRRGNAKCKTPLSVCVILVSTLLWYSNLDAPVLPGNQHGRLHQPL